METPDLGVWFAPFELKFLHGNFVPHPKDSARTLEEKARWLEHLKFALKTVTPEIAGDLLGHEHGRVQLCGAWFCGLKRWEDLAVPLGHQLVRNERASATQGLSFALSRMASHASANALCGYLNRVGRAGDSTGQYREEAPWVLAALQWIDAQMNTRRAAEYIERLTPILQQHAFDSAQQRYREAGSRWRRATFEAARQGRDGDDPRWQNHEIVERWREDAEAEMQQFFRPHDESERPDWFWQIMEFCAQHIDGEPPSPALTSGAHLVE